MRIPRKYLMNSKPFAPDPETAFRDLIVSANFPCVGAKAAFNSKAETVRLFDELGGTESTKNLAEALSQFTRLAEQDPVATADQARTEGASSIQYRPSEYATFVAIFDRPRQCTEIEFENLLWQQLRLLHDWDRRHSEWDKTVAADPDDPHFSFSFGGHALYVIGMHANSSREARRFPWPTLVFNPHKQFERLRAEGKWPRMQETIRDRDRDLQGTVNPMLSDFGVESEARQYSGRAVEENWRAPFSTSARKCPFAH